MGAAFEAIRLDTARIAESRHAARSLADALRTVRDAATESKFALMQVGMSEAQVGRFTAETAIMVEDLDRVGDAAGRARRQVEQLELAPRPLQRDASGRFVPYSQPRDSFGRFASPDQFVGGMPPSFARGATPTPQELADFNQAQYLASLPPERSVGTYRARLAQLLAEQRSAGGGIMMGAAPGRTSFAEGEQAYRDMLAGFLEAQRGSGGGIMMGPGSTLRDFGPRRALGFGEEGLGPFISGGARRPSPSRTFPFVSEAEMGVSQDRGHGLLGIFMGRSFATRIEGITANAASGAVADRGGGGSDAAGIMALLMGGASRGVPIPLPFFGRGGLRTTRIGAGLPALGSILGLAGFGAERALGSTLGIAGSAVGGLAGAGLYGLGAAGVLGVGMGTDMAGLGQASGDIKLVSTDLSQLNTAIVTYGKNSRQAATAQKQLNADLKSFSPVARDSVLAAAKTSQSFKHMFDQLSGPAENKGAQLINQAMLTGEAFLPTIGTFASQNMSIIQKGLQPFFAWLQSQKGGLGIFTDLEKIFQQSLPTGVHATTQGLEVFLHLVDDAAQHTGGLVHVVDHFFTKINTPGGLAKMNEEVSTLIGLAGTWARLFSSLGHLVFDLFKPAVGFGQDFVTQLTHIVNLTRDWLTAAGTQNVLHNLFAAHRAQVDALFSVFQALMPLLQNVLSAFLQIEAAVAHLTVGPLKLLADLITTISSAFGGVIPKILGWAGAVLLAQRAITALYKAMLLLMGSKWISWITDGVAGLTAWVTGITGATVAMGGFEEAQVAAYTKMVAFNGATTTSIGLLGGLRAALLGLGGGAIAAALGVATGVVAAVGLDYYLNTHQFKKGSPIDVGGRQGISEGGGVIDIGVNKNTSVSYNAKTGQFSELTQHGAISGDNPISLAQAAALLGMTPERLKALLVGGVAGPGTPNADAAAKARHGLGMDPALFRDPGVGTPYLTNLLAHAQSTITPTDDRTVLRKIIATLTQRQHTPGISLAADTALTQAISGYKAELAATYPLNQHGGPHHTGRQPSALDQVLPPHLQAAISSGEANLVSARSALQGAQSPQEQIKASQDLIRVAKEYEAQLQRSLDHLRAEHETGKLLVAQKREELALTRQQAAAERDIRQALKEQADARLTIKAEHILGLGPGGNQVIPSARQLLFRERQLLTRDATRSHLDTSRFQHENVQQIISDMRKQGFVFPQSTLDSLEKINKVLELAHKGQKLGQDVLTNIRDRLTQINDTLKQNKQGLSNYVPYTSEQMTAGLGLDRATRMALESRIAQGLAHHGMHPRGGAAAGIPLNPDGSPVGRATPGHGGRSPGPIGAAPPLVSEHGRWASYNNYTVKIVIDGTRTGQQIARAVREELLKTSRRNSAQTRGPNAGRGVGLG